MFDGRGQIGAMKIVTTIARILLGLMFTVFGLNGFLHFIPMGPQPSGAAGQFIGALASTHYLHFVFAVQVISGVLFLIGRYVRLALMLIGPVIVNILLFHATLEPHGIAMGLFAAALWLLLFIRDRRLIDVIFTPRTGE